VLKCNLVAHLCNLWVEIGHHHRHSVGGEARRKRPANAAYSPANTGHDRRATRLYRLGRDTHHVLLKATGRTKPNMVLITRVRGCS
jgi:hypothetical protein